MKKPTQMSLVGLVLRLVALKLQSQILNARRKALRAEIMERLPQNVPQVIAGWRVRLGWRNPTESFHRSPGKWQVFIKRPLPCQKETTL
jgi:hypothetical protein